jgi:hypothetical protein
MSVLHISLQTLHTRVLDYCKTLFLFFAFCRVYEVQAVSTTPGEKDATVELTRPDSNPDNDKDDAVVSFILTCANPFGNGTRPTCPPGFSFTGPLTKPIGSSDVFGAQCCVSGLQTVLLVSYGALGP